LPTVAETARVDAAAAGWHSHDHGLRRMALKARVYSLLLLHSEKPHLHNP